MSFFKTLALVCCLAFPTLAAAETGACYFDCDNAGNPICAQGPRSQCNGQGVEQLFFNAGYTGFPRCLGSISFKRGACAAGTDQSHAGGGDQVGACYFDCDNAGHPICAQGPKSECNGRGVEQLFLDAGYNGFPRCLGSVRFVSGSCN